MSDRDESYRATTARRRRYGALSHFAIVEREGRDPDEPPAATGELLCSKCKAPTPVLHADPDSSSPQRTICGGCQGAANARQIGRAR